MKLRIPKAHRLLRRAFLLTCLLTWQVSAAGAAPLSFNTALPVSEGEFVFREQFIFSGSGHDPGTASRNLQVFSAVSVLGYGLHNKLAVFGALPYRDKSLEITKNGVRQVRSTSGLGDFTVFGRYTVIQIDGPGRTFRVAPLAGVELPTGENDATDALGRLPQMVQAGSGSTNPFGGIVATFQSLDFEVDAQINHKANTSVNGFDAGDVSRLDGSFQYRLWPGSLETPVPGFLYGVLEGNLIHQGRNRNNGIRDPNSGGTTLFLLPGFLFVTSRWILEGGLQVPVIQDLNGTALEKGLIGRFGFRINF